MASSKVTQVVTETLHWFKTECMTTLTLANASLSNHAALRARVVNSQQAHRRLLGTPSPSLPQIPLFRASPSPEPPASSPSRDITNEDGAPFRPDLPRDKRLRALRYAHYSPEEETIRNDYSQRYVDGGEWPQNWVLGAEPERRFEESVTFLLALSLATNCKLDIPSSSVSSTSRNKQWPPVRSNLPISQCHPFHPFIHINSTPS